MNTELVGVGEKHIQHVFIYCDTITLIGNKTVLFGIRGLESNLTEEGDDWKYFMWNLKIGFLDINLDYYCLQSPIGLYGYAT